MTDRHMLIAFLSTLAAIVVLFALACVCLYNGKSVEAIGIGGVMTGLIGVLGTFRPTARAAAPTGIQDVNITNPVTDPVPTTTEKSA
jgi:hypothetical protein